METTETRRVGNHFFVFEKNRSNAREKSRTLIAPCVAKNDEKLPREFVNYMRSLFDILDEGRRGFVKLSDIEACWGQKNGHVGPQPAGVLESLRRVAPPNGLLSFERLCLGFQLALRPSEGKFDEPTQLTVTEFTIEKRHDISREKSCKQSTNDDKKTLTDDPTLFQNMQPRPRSMVQLHQQEKRDLSLAKRKGGILEGIQSTDKATVIDKLRQWHQEKSRKANNGMKAKARTEANSYSKVEKTANSRQIVAQAATGNESDSEHRQSKQHSTHKKSHLRFPKAIVHYQGQKPNAGLKGGSRNTGIHNSKTVISKDPTLENLEDELKVLSEGLCAVEEVRDWLFTRITAIQEEKLYIKSVPKYSSQDYEAMIYSNRRRELGLNASNFKTLASHIQGLKSHLYHILQNPLTSSLPKEVESDSKQRIAQLEKEKSALIRELFQYKSQHERRRLYSR